MMLLDPLKHAFQNPIQLGYQLIYGKRLGQEILYPQGPNFLPFLNMSF